MNQPIAMSMFTPARDRKDEQTIGAAAEDDPGRNVDYALVIVGVVYVVFAVFGFFVAGEIMVY